MRTPLLLLLLLSACADVRPGSPEACAVEPRGSFAMDLASGRPVVDVQVNGRPSRLLLDTGANVTFFTTAAAERLGLRGDGVYRSTSKSIGGEAQSHPSQVDSFAFAGMSLPLQRAVVVPLDARGIAGSDGLLGIDVLRQFDIELDMAARTGTLYRARNCPATPPPGLPLPQTFVMPNSTSPHPEIAVELDGRRLIALLDTGATAVTVDRGAALRLGVTEQQLQADQVVPVAGALSTDNTSVLHRFGALVIGGVRVPNPSFVVARLPPSGAEMVIGMVLMRERKVWFSFASRRIHLGAPQRTAPPARP